MVPTIYLSAIILALFASRGTAHPQSLPPDTTPFTIILREGSKVLVNNSAVLVGTTNTSVLPISVSKSGDISNNGGKVTYRNINPYLVEVKIDTRPRSFIGARFNALESSLFYGVWEYPFSNKLENNGIKFDLKGIGNAAGVNWCNARAPFFITSDPSTGSGYGVYADTLSMGSFDFTKPGQAQFIFNTSSLVYYIILPEKDGGYKSIIEQYTALSERIEMPPDSAYGPTFWSDDFTTDFHGSVTNAEENYYDVINHLYDNKIRATAMFADRPYGTGSRSWGNFDFDPKFYPNPKRFIQNLTDYGFDFQVWVANRAQVGTTLYNDSLAKNWFLPSLPTISGNLGPALNLSIPAAYNYFKSRLAVFPNLGVKGYKIDRGEEDEMPLYEQNIQNVLIDKLCYESMAEKWGSSNFYIFARSVVDRGRSKANVWNGDSHANFTGLAYSISSGIRSGIMGFSNWGSDTGGYIRNSKEPTEELWARWMWFSTFSPVYEIMVGTKHTPWYSPYTSRLVKVLKDSANEHVRLVPFIKSHTYQASRDGVPVMRALFMEFPNDTKVYGIGDEYFFGSEFLVAPIVQAGGGREVYFPHGARWLEYFNKTQVHEGGMTKSMTLPWEKIPVFVREGAIVPTGDIYQGNLKWGKQKWEPYLEIEVFPGYGVEESSFVYFDGVSKRQVEISMKTNGKNKGVEVQYGELGVKATLIVFGKDGNRTFALERMGGKVAIAGFISLFA